MNLLHIESSDNLTKAFYLKSSLTLYKLVEYCELDFDTFYHQIMEMYTEMNTENTLKLLIRSKKLCNVKNTLIQIFKAISRREEISTKIKSICIYLLILCIEILENNTQSQIDPQIQKSIAKESTFLFKLTHKILELLQELRDVKFFEKMPFVWGAKVYDKMVKNEVIGIKRIINLVDSQ